MKTVDANNDNKKTIRGRGLFLAASTVRNTKPRPRILNDNLEFVFIPAIETYQSHGDHEIRMENLKKIIITTNDKKALKLIERVNSMQNDIKLLHTRIRLGSRATNISGDHGTRLTATAGVPARATSSHIADRNRIERLRRAK